MIFERLPNVKNCCCFLPLKAGTIFIAFIFMILSVANNKLQLKEVEGYECYSGVLDETCPLKQEMMYVTDATIFVAFMYFLPSALLVVGVLKNIRKLVTVFLYFISMSILAAEIIDWTVLIIGAAQPACGTSYETRIKCAVGDTFFLFVSIYFLIVVKSFRNTMVIVNTDRSRLALRTPHKPNEKIRVHITDTRGALNKSSLIEKVTSSRRTSAFRNTSSKSSSEDYIPNASRPQLKSSASDSKDSSPLAKTPEQKSSSGGPTSSNNDRHKSIALHSSTDTITEQSPPNTDKTQNK